MNGKDRPVLERRRDGGAGHGRSPKARASGIPHDARVFRLALLGGLPAILATAVLLVVYDAGAKIGWTVSVVVVCCWLFTALALRERVLRPLQTASNLVAALREGDFSVRGRAARLADPLGELMFELNQLSDLLREQRLGRPGGGAPPARGGGGG